MNGIFDKNFDPLKDYVPSSLAFYRPMNKRELCEYLRMNSGTLEYYNAQGLPRFKIGNEIRYSLPDVLNFFRGRGINPRKERFAYASEVEG